MDIFKNVEVMKKILATFFFQTMVYVLPVGDWVAGPVVRWAARLAQFVLFNGIEVLFVVGIGYVGIQAAEVWGARMRRMWVSWRDTWGGGRRDDPLENIGEFLANMADLPPGPLADAGLADFVGGAAWEAEDIEE